MIDEETHESCFNCRKMIAPGAGRYAYSPGIALCCACADAGILPPPAEQVESPPTREWGSAD